MDDAAEQARRRAIALAGDTMSELVSFWGFKPSMGKIWTLLYLEDRPLTADVIAEQTHLSAGSVSMALTELLRWGIVAREPTPTARKRHYRAETDVWRIVRRIFRERELRLIDRSVARFEEALALLDEAKEAGGESEQLDVAKKRLEGLIKLARIGHRVVERLADVGTVSLDPIRGTLSRALGRER